MDNDTYGTVEGGMGGKPAPPPKHEQVALHGDEPCPDVRDEGVASRKVAV
jgi:hypothetical protein